jgi:hypothetical protein
MSMPSALSGTARIDHVGERAGGELVTAEPLALNVV